MIVFKKPAVLVFCLTGVLFFEGLLIQRASSSQPKKENPRFSDHKENQADPKQFLLSLLEKVKDSKGQNDLKFEEKFKKFHSLFLSYFDLKKISQFVLGRYWRTATPEQKEKFTAVFLDYALLTFFEKFDSLSQGEIHINSIHSLKNYYIIRSKYTIPNQEPFKVDWYIIKPKQGARLKIFDVRIEGISFTFVWRDEYRSVIGREGLNELINKLTKMVNRKKEKMG